MLKIINKLTLTIISFYIIYLGILPVIINNTAIILCRKISHNSNYEITVDSPQTRFSILPYVSFGAKEVTVKSKTGLNQSEIKDFKAKIRLLPLLSGKVHINVLEADSAKILLNIRENAGLDKNFFEKLENTHISCDCIKINNFETNLYRKDIKTPILYKGENFLFIRGNRYVKFNINSTLKAGNNVSEVNLNLFLPKNNNIKKTVFDVKVSNLDIEPFGIYFRQYLPKGVTGLKGSVNIHANKGGLITELKNCSAVMKNPSNSIIFPDILNIKSDFNINRHRINFKSVEINSENIHIMLEGKIYNYFGKAMPTLDMNIQIDNSKVEDIINLLPPFKIEEIDVYKLKKYKFYGDIIGNFSIKGRLPEPEVNGDIFINNGILTKPIPNTSRGAVIKLHLSGRYINFDVSVPAGGSEKVLVKGGQELYNIKYSDFTVKSTQNVDLQTAETVVNPLHEILNFIIGPVPIMNICGKGNIDISVKGNRKNPHIWGVLNVRNTYVYFNEIPDLKLTDAEASLIFNNQDAVFAAKKGLLNGKNLNINGTCTLLGKFDFTAESYDQPTESLYKAIQTSTLIPDIKNMLPELENLEGKIDFNIKVYGAVRVIEDLKFNKNAFAKGEISIKDNRFTFRNMHIDRTNGSVKFDGSAADADLTALIGGADMSIKANVKNNIADLFLNIPKLNPNLLLTEQDIRAKGMLPVISVSAKYKGNINDIEYDKINLDSEITGSVPEGSIKYRSGKISAANNRIIIKNLDGYINDEQSNFQADLKIDDAFSQKPFVNGAVHIKTPDLSMFNELFAGELLPKNIKNYLKDFEFQKGKIDLNCKISNNKINARSDLNGISFIYLPLKLPVNIINGTLLARNNMLLLDKINILADKMPVLLDGEIKDITNGLNFDIYMNTKPKQDFIDKYINTNSIYPVKIKGDIVCSAGVRGSADNYTLKSTVNMNKDSSIYYYGATIGDVENAIVLDLNSKITGGKNFKIKDFSYDKLVDSQRGKQTRLNMLKVRGGTEFIDGDMNFKDLRIKTSNPTDARIFNIIFKKPNIKQGQFTSDLKLNGRFSNLRVLGDFYIFETNIPFLDTTLKNIALVFKDRVIEVSSKGDVLGNDMTFDGVMKNKLSSPYKLEKAVLYTKDFNLNNIVEKLKVSQVDNAPTFESFEGFDLSSIIFSNLLLKADRVHLRNIDASDFEAEANLNENGIFDIKKFSFNIAQGNLDGKYKFNLQNNDMNLYLNAENINANDITIALFDLSNQIYGEMTGVVEFSCNGTDFQSCMETISGNSVFSVKDGRMPKLGSLEYLLKAGNLIKGGVTGLSINSVIDIITPLKTGEFSNIYGNIRIKDGIARNIEITSTGKTLNLYISGVYNFAASMAEMEVFGTLSKKISTMFGPIGNMSINTLFNVIPGVDFSKDSLILEKINKIPGIEFSNKDYRKFTAEIKGDINGDDYVTSFKWIN